ncbi:MAG: GNAT family N-acetyltransferase [Vicingaceae bacterium]
MLSCNKKYYQPKESERLSYAPLSFKDVSVWETFVLNPKATQYFPEHMQAKPGLAKQWIQGQMKRYAENSFGLMAIRKKQNHEFIGQCGLLIQEVDGKKEIEIGYHLLPKYWGKGYASEAAQMFKQIGFEDYFASSIISLIHTENIPSQKVAERNGMKKDGKTTHKNLDAYIFRINRK